MRAVEEIRGSVIPLQRANVDTDQIIPKQFLKSIRRTGFGDNLFDGWRYLDEGDIGRTPNERSLNREFVLNDPRYQGGCVLLALDNFGCGSSREHAVWALLEYGIECVIAPSFADIFYNNASKNGLLAVVLPQDVISEMMALATGKEPLSMTVNLAEQTIDGADRRWQFEIDPQLKERLLSGADDIALTLAHAAEIRAFESAHRQTMPWIFT